MGARVALVAKKAQALVCRGLGIVQNGEDVTDRALDALACEFKEQLHPEIIARLRELFRFDDDQAVAVEDALISHGGEDALDHEEGTQVSHACD